MLDATHHLYTWEGTWKLGVSGKSVAYMAALPSHVPPESNGGCGEKWIQSGTAGEGKDPCPAVHRLLPPYPPGPPPPPPPPVPPVPPLPPRPPMRLAWEDGFDGPSLNSSLWNVLEQVHRGGVYTRDNVRVAGGALVLRTVAQNLTIDGTDYYITSGGVNTSKLAEQRQGRWEARVKLPLVGSSAGYTLHSSIWLFSDESNPERSGCPQEIDVVEQYAAGTAPSDPRSRAAANLHPFSGNRSSGCKKIGYRRPPRTAAIGDWTDRWTRFAVDWTQDWIAMSVDDKPYALFEGDGVAVEGETRSALSSYTDPLFLALTACVMQRLPPNPADTFPLEFLVDWVRVFEWMDEES